MRLILFFGWPRQDKGCIARFQFCEGGDEQIQAFFRMQSRKKKHDRTIAQLWMALSKLVSRRKRFEFAQINDVPLDQSGRREIQPGRQIALQFVGEMQGQSASQIIAQSKRQVQPLLQSTLRQTPWIEHAVGGKEIGLFESTGEFCRAMLNLLP